MEHYRLGALLEIQKVLYVGCFLETWGPRERKWAGEVPCWLCWLEKVSTETGQGTWSLTKCDSGILGQKKKRVQLTQQGDSGPENSEVELWTSRAQTSGASVCSSQLSILASWPRFLYLLHPVLVISAQAGKWPLLGEVRTKVGELWVPWGGWVETYPVFSYPKLTVFFQIKKKKKMGGGIKIRFNAVECDNLLKSGVYSFVSPCFFQMRRNLHYIPLVHWLFALTIMQNVC